MWDEIQKIIADSENNLFSASGDEYVYSQEILNEGIRLPAPNKRGNEIERDVSKRKKARKNDLQPRNGRSSYESLLSYDKSNKEHDEDDMEIKFDLTSFSTELQREPIVKHLFLIILGALSSIIVLSLTCPYPSLFTIQEWKEVTKNNPFAVQESSLSPDILSSLNEASFNHFLGMDTFMEGGKSKLSRIAARSFNDL
ncbi:6896_t:CDS:2 [Funneliformis geosporum]|uniref:6896_t:CDS:1 n=1 Tax=Funneliformis geosporum TaxID=1117311 RepID=A0A9W4SXD0_9GLOM|nr:6896_t:CDS:2 [Funneliformis geosporum]